MKRLFGGPGTVTGLLLRLGQCAFGAASIGLMVTSIGFSGFTAFWYSSNSLILVHIYEALFQFSMWVFNKVFN